MRNRIGIRREDKNKWETRAPLSPAQVAEGASTHGLSFIVQRSSLRAFSDADYEACGATVADDLSGAGVVLAVKEVPISAIEADRVYVFFSHTVKGQPYNMQMLAEILMRKVTLIDYEKITDPDGRRLVYFGNWAGYAGLVDTLRGYGLRKDIEGTPNPFAALRPTHEYSDLGAVRAAVAEVGRVIRETGLPASLSPLVVGIAGYGNVSRGVQDLLRELPVQEISPDELQDVDPSNAHTLYMTVFHEKDTVRRRDGGPFDLREYMDKPELYEGVFASYLPYISILINAVYWSAEYPRLVSDADIARLFEAASATGPRLTAIGDISCDVEGAVECTKISTEPDHPVYVFDPHDGSVHLGVEGSGPVIMAVDNLPCELPKESSQTFGESLMPFLPSLGRADFAASFESLDLPDELKRAVIAHQGRLTPNYRYLRQHLTKSGVTP